MNKTRNSRFQRGSGVFSCGCCKRKTRATGDDNEGVGLCIECYDMSALENSISDNPADDPNVPVWQAEIAKLRIKIVEKGGRLPY